MIWRTVYMLCDRGRLARVRVMNAIRVQPAALLALVRSRAEQDVMATA